MTVCFYFYASKLEHEADAIERGDVWFGEPSAVQPARLRRLAADMRRDSRPCIRFPDCGCAGASLSVGLAG